MKKFISLAVITILILAAKTATSQNITFTNFPKHYQLYPRNDQDSAFVNISGTVTPSGNDEIIVEVDTNNVLWKRRSQGGISGGNAPFSFNIGIYADTVNFKFRVILKQGATETPIDSVDEVACGDVYFINGQSNAVADYGGVSTNQWVRSFGDAKNAPQSAQDTTWRLAESVSASGQEGFVGSWGLSLGILIVENHGVPVCIIQQGDGGQKIDYFIDHIGTGNLRFNFEQLFLRATNAGVVDDVKAIFWWQGEKDADDSSVESYYRSEFLVLYNGWRTYFPGIQKVYTTQIHPYGPYGDRLREIQRKISEDSSKIEIITPHNIEAFDGVVHFGTTGYINYAAKLYRLIARDFYGNTDTTDINPPNIQKAYFTDSNKNVLVLEFDNVNPLTFVSDTTISSTNYFLKDHFYFHHNGTRDSAIVNNIMVYNNKVRLALTQSSTADSISYLPARYYNDQSSVIYDGPWINNSNGVSALTFYEFPIDAQPGDDPLPVTLSVFTAEYLENGIKLKWRTESEINNLGFILLRKSGNQQDYQQIASYEHDERLRGQGTTTQATDYEFIDTGVSEGETYTYLLMDVDYNGNKVRHGPLTVTAVEGTPPEGYNLFQNYPNPFNPVTHIAFTLPEIQNVRLRVFDLLGREVEVLLDDKAEAGYHEIPFNAENLKSGLYFYEIRTPDYHAVRKMVLTK